MLSPVMIGFLGSLAAGLMTGVGALPVLLGRILSRRWRDTSLGFAAGVTLAASFFSLIIPALEVAYTRSGDGPIPAVIVCIAILLGRGIIGVMNEFAPREHFSSGREGPEAASLRRIWLFVIAITIHNAPEGLGRGGLLSVRTDCQAGSQSRSG
jgi:ZIP family zinc transporter